MGTALLSSLLLAQPAAAYESVAPGASASISASVTQAGSSVTLTVTYFQLNNSAGIPGLDVNFFAVPPAGCHVTLGSTVGVTDGAGQSSTPASLDPGCTGQTIPLCGRDTAGLTVCASVLVLGFPNTLRGLADGATAWSGLPPWSLLSILAGLLLIAGGTSTLLFPTGIRRPNARPDRPQRVHLAAECTDPVRNPFLL
ncbi:MAG: hypothetical protein NVS9B1_22800 [Candidatus Dormibacteraceae bacterium]